MRTQKCRCCGEVKPLSDYYKYKNNLKIGYRLKCKVCYYSTATDRNKTIKGLIFNLYRRQKANSIKRGHINPDYTKEELYTWMNNQQIFFNLYNAWVKSGYETNLSPSCDRLNDYKPYTLNNIRLVAWGENNKRYYSDVKNGVNNKANKAVIKKTKGGEFIKEYYSMSQAMRETNIKQQGICACCKGKAKSAGGYNWSYA